MSTVPPDQISSLARSLGRNRAVRRMRALLIARRGSEAVMVALAAVVGLVTGLLAVALIMLVEAVQEVSFGSLPDVPAVLLMPALGGLVVGLLTWKAVPEARGSGISSVMMAIAVRGGRIRPIVGPGKLVASAVSLGTGSSGGREGPIVQIGASVASSIGRFFALDEERLRSLIAASAAGAMAASYNAPIGGMLFAIEVIVGGFNIRSLQTIVVSAVIASVTARQIIGEALIYNPPQYTLVHPWELGLYAGLGLLAVAVGIGFSRLEQLVEQATRHLRVPHPLVTAGGALMVGAIALAVPEVLGSGDRLPDVLGVNTEPVAAMLDGEFSLQFLLLLLFAKMLASGIALGTGSAVGSFTPLIVLGAALGGAYGQVAAMVLPVEGLNPGAYALVGTAGVVAAGAHAPLTGVLLVFELTGSYELVLPLMLTTGLATFISERVTTGSLYTRPLLEAGVVYAEPEDVDIMQTVRVGEIMSTGVETIGPRQSVAHLREALRRSRHHGHAVVTRAAQRLAQVGDRLARTDGLHTGRHDLADADGLHDVDVLGLGVHHTRLQQRPGVQRSGGYALGDEGSQAGGEHERQNQLVAARQLEHQQHAREGGVGSRGDHARRADQGIRARVQPLHGQHHGGHLAVRPAERGTQDDQRRERSHRAARAERDAAGQHLGEEQEQQKLQGELAVEHRRDRLGVHAEHVGQAVTAAEHLGDGQGDRTDHQGAARGDERMRHAQVTRGLLDQLLKAREADADRHGQQAEAGVEPELPGVHQRVLRGVVDQGLADDLARGHRRDHGGHHDRLQTADVEAADDHLDGEQHPADGGVVGGGHGAGGAGGDQRAEALLIQGEEAADARGDARADLDDGAFASTRGPGAERHRRGHQLARPDDRADAAATHGDGHHHAGDSRSAGLRDGLPRQQAHHQPAEGWHQQNGGHVRE